VSFERLWAPWRLEYVTGSEPKAAPPEPQEWLPSADHDCFVCRAAAKYSPEAPADQSLLVVSRGPQVLISPRRHVGELAQMTDDEHLACMQLLAKLTELYREQMNAEGFNIGLNLGRVAGAGLPGHLHWHLVPRWAGDNNFMPVLAGTRVIPQSLDALWEMLRGALD
jgi:ATP adenylyltransferase